MSSPSNNTVNAKNASHSTRLKMGKKPKIKAVPKVKLAKKGPPLSEKTTLKLSSQLARYLQVESAADSVMVDKSTGGSTPVESAVSAKLGAGAGACESENDWEIVQDLEAGSSTGDMALKSSLSWADRVSSQTTHLTDTCSHPYPGLCGRGRGLSLQAGSAGQGSLSNGQRSAQPNLQGPCTTREPSESWTGELSPQTELKLKLNSNSISFLDLLNPQYNTLPKFHWSFWHITESL